MDASPQREPEINKLFRMARKLGASDLYLQVGSAPLFKLQGATPKAEMRPLTQEDLACLVAPILNAEQRERLSQGNEVTITYALQEGVAYRVAVSSNSGQLHVAAQLLGESSSG